MEIHVREDDSESIDSTDSAIQTNHENQPFSEKPISSSSLNHKPSSRSILSTSKGFTRQPLQAYPFISHTPQNYHAQPTADDPSLVRKRRRRTSPAELEILENEFRVNDRPSREARLRVAQRLAMEPREIQIWFQNRRQASRRKGSGADDNMNSKAENSSQNSSTSSSSRPSVRLCTSEKGQAQLVVSRPVSDDEDDGKLGTPRQFQRSKSYQHDSISEQQMPLSQSIRTRLPFNRSNSAFSFIINNQSNGKLGKSHLKLASFRGKENVPPSLSSRTLGIHKSANDMSGRINKEAGDLDEEECARSLAMLASGKW